MSGYTERGSRHVVRRLRGGKRSLADRREMATSATAERVARPARVIKPTYGWAALRLSELWVYRELLYFLTWRDIKVRYKQAVLGVIWAVLQPVITMVVFTIVFQKIAHISYKPAVVNGREIPYPIFTYVGLLPWNLFSAALGRAGTSVVGNANLLTKVYFPRLVIPISAVIGGIPDFLIAFVVFLALMAAYKITPTWHMVFLPPLVLLAMATALAFGLWFSALNVLYRDVGYIIPFVVQLGMFLTPVIYPAPTLAHHTLFRIIYNLNPMVGVVEGFRWALIGGDPPNGLVVVSSIVACLVLVTGLIYFKRMERTFADVV
jgi:lipopolysaccharide transport system permease protein